MLTQENAPHFRDYARTETSLAYTHGAKEPTHTHIKINKN